jgi:hypothetical protein
MTVESRRVALLFVCYQVGTPQEITELVNFSSRASPNDVGIEDSVSGEPTNMAPNRRRRREGVATHTYSSGVVLKTAVGMMAESVASNANEQISSKPRGG